MRFGLRQAKGLLIAHSDQMLPSIFAFSLSDLLEAYPGSVEEDALRRVIRRWAYSFGDLANHKSEHFFLANPIWSRPIIDLGGDRFFWPVPGLFQSYCLELMEAIIEPYDSLRRKYEERRTQFLEEEIERLFRSAFPSATIYRGCLWHDPLTGKDLENDLVMLIDSFLLVVEAKSGRVTGPARRGAEDRLERTIGKLLVEPSEQSKRLEDHLCRNALVHEFSTKTGETFQIDSARLSRIGRLNVTLDWLGDLHSHWPTLRKAGFIPTDSDLAPTLSLADLELVFDVLSSSAEKIHYLIRRSEFENNAEYIGDESDLLSFYLDTGFNIGRNEFDGSGLFLVGMSKALDPYFLSKEQHTASRKPRRRLTKWWRDLLAILAQRRKKQWLEISYHLLCLAYEDQVAFEKGFLRTQQTVQILWRLPEHENTFFLSCGPEQRRTVVVGVAYKRLDNQARNSTLAAAAKEALRTACASQAVIIGVDVDHRGYPYDVLADYPREQP